MAKQLINFVNDDGSKVAIETNAPAMPCDGPAEPMRLRKVPGKVTDNGLEVIRDAISLKRATQSYRICMTEGEALTSICATWLEAESARLSGKGGA